MVLFLKVSTTKNTRIPDFTAYPPPITPPINNGVWLDQTDECTVSNSKFHYCKNGLQYYNTHSNQATTTITENVFFNNQFGLVMASSNHPNTCGSICNNTNTNTIAVNIGCNNFLLNNVGIFGCGKLNDIGGAQESGNIFIWSNSNNNNIDWDFLWDDLSGNANQKHIELNSGGQGFAYYDINKPNHNTLNPYQMNSNVAFSLNGFKGNSNGGAPSGCNRSAGRAFAPQESMNEITQQIISYFPNPFYDLLNITINSIDEQEIFYYEIFDMTGRITQKGKLSISNSINCSSMPSGAYIIKIFSNKGFNQYNKINKLNN